jgi:hypothetical protein
VVQQIRTQVASKFPLLLRRMLPDRWDHAVSSSASVTQAARLILHRRYDGRSLAGETDWDTSKSKAERSDKPALRVTKFHVLLDYLNPMKYRSHARIFLQPTSPNPESYSRLWRKAPSSNEETPNSLGGAVCAELVGGCSFLLVRPVPLWRQCDRETD